MKKLILLALIFIFSNAQSKWIFVSTVPTSPNTSTISVVNANLIWLCGVIGGNGAVFRSTDGGTTWLNRKGDLPSVNFFGLSALDTSNCWVGTVAGSIYRTTNGGTNWTIQFSLAGSFSNGIKMFNSSYGVYIGDPTGNGQPYQLRYTTNGGTNWLLSPGAPLATNEFGVINAWDWTDTTNFWMGSANIVANATTSKVYKTTSGFGGGGWTSATLTGKSGAAGLYYQAVAFINASSGMVGSNGTNLRKTTDGGVTWQTATNPPGIASFAAINMNGLKDGSNTIRASLTTITGNHIFKTTNLGTTWISESHDTLVGTNGLHHMQFVNANFGYGGGNAGSFFRYGNTRVNIKLAIEALYNAGGNTMLSDTVRAYLRNITTPFAVVDSALAVIDPVTLTGNYVFENAASGTYYIQLKYRSGLETWSKSGGESYVFGGLFNYDFTFTASQAFGSNMVQVDASPVRFAIYSGDANQDGVIDITDGGMVDNDAFNFLTGYVSTDVNFDDVVDVSDAAIVDNNAFNFVAKVTP